MKKNNKINLTYQTLKIIALVGAIPVAFIAPNILKAINPLLNGEEKARFKRKGKEKITNTIWKLKNRGLVINDNQNRLVLTEKGREVLVKYKLNNIKLKKTKRWDRKWRLIAFDVWEERRSTRNTLRRIIKNAGFVQLQGSLWVYPYDCQEFIGLLRTDLKLSLAIQYMVVEKIDRDQWLRKHFNLPLK